MNLLRKFKANEEDGARAEGSKNNPVADIDELFDELEGLSDSEPEADNISIGSIPKPALPPFFASSKSLLNPQYRK